MTETIPSFPKAYAAIDSATKALGFTMASDALTGSLLRTLAATKVAGRFLELGTGTGLATAWISEGMDSNSTLVSIDNDNKLLDVARKHLGDDRRLEFVVSDGGDWINQNRHNTYDYIFADTWHGKYLLLEETLSMLKKGGLYIIDDMLPQATWPEGHREKVTNLLRSLEAREDLILTKMVWSTGIVIAVKK